MSIAVGMKKTNYKHPTRADLEGDLLNDFIPTPSPLTSNNHLYGYNMFTVNNQNNSSKEKVSSKYMDCCFIFMTMLLLL